MSPLLVEKSTTNGPSVPNVTIPRLFERLLTVSSSIPSTPLIVSVPPSVDPCWATKLVFEFTPGAP